MKFDGSKKYVLGKGYLDHLEIGTLEIAFAYQGKSMRTVALLESFRSTRSFYPSCNVSQIFFFLAHFYFYYVSFIYQIP